MTPLPKNPMAEQTPTQTPVEIPALPPSPLGVLKTQFDAVAFLRDRGFKISKSAFGRDFK